MSEKLFSIVTVVFNDKKNLYKTLISVNKQKEVLENNIEYIIIDGGSTDGTLEIIESAKNIIDKWISESDEGLYDAMNKGIDLASGKYLIFMNAGDRFAEHDTLLKVKKEIIINEYPDFIYGDAIEEDTKGNKYLKKAYSHKYIWYGMFTHHQSMFYKLDLLKKFNLKYNLKYKIAADYAFTYEYLKNINEDKILRLDFSICIFLQGGTSAVNYKIGLSEANDIRKEIGNLESWQISFINMAHKFKHFFRKNLKPIYNFFRYKGT